MNGPERISEPERAAGAERRRPDGRGVRELTAADAHAAGSALALAFETDPHMQWIFHDSGQRLAPTAHVGDADRAGMGPAR